MFDEHKVDETNNRRKPKAFKEAYPKFVYASIYVIPKNNFGELGMNEFNKQSFRRCLPPIRSGEIIDYININLLHKFSSEQGRILSRRMNRLTLKQQLLMTIAIRQA